MKYEILLDHTDFCLLMGALKKAKESGVIAWSACNLVCRNTKVVFDEMEG